MKQAKISFTFNGWISTSVFNYESEEELRFKLNKWKEDNLTSYNKVENVSIIYDWNCDATNSVTSFHNKSLIQSNL